MFSICRLILIATVALFGLCCYILAIKFGNVFLFFVVLGGVAWAVRRRRGKLTAYGTARWAGQEDVRRAGMADGHGLIVGTLYDRERPSRIGATFGLFNPVLPSMRASCEFLHCFLPGIKGNSPLIRLSQAVHTAIFAPTGAGKGVSCAIPFLLECPDSCVVVDFKGELARATMKRRRRMGHRIVLLDPYNMVTNKPDGLNPLDFIKADSPHMIDEIRDLAESLVIRTGQERDPHWNDSAAAWIAAAAAAVAQYGDSDDRSMQTIRSLLASSPEKLDLMIKLLCSSDACDGMLSRLGYQLTQFKDKELSSTLTTVNRFLRFLDTLAVASGTKSSSFDPNRLTQEKTTVYLILPPEHARAQSPLLRMWIGALLRGVVRGGLQEYSRVHFLIDEAATLGHLEQLDDAVDKYRGYGVRLIFIYQSLGQLKKCFPEGQDQTLLGNVTQVFFGVNDPQTAEYVSSRLGEETIIIASGGTSRGATSQHSEGHVGGSYSRSSNSNNNWQQHGRKLLKPEEVMALPPRTAITFAAGVPPIRTRLMRYYEGRRDSFLRQQWQGVKLCIYSIMLGVVVLFVASFAAAIRIQPMTTRPLPAPGVSDRRSLQEQGVHHAFH